MFKILIAEDNRELRQLFQHVLLKNGYTVKGVSDGQEALDALEKDYYDLIISDIMMPNMDGYELIRSLRDAILECDSLTVSTASESMVLSQKEFMLLYKMVAFPGKIFTRQQLMDDIWRYDSASNAQYQVFRSCTKAEKSLSFHSP
jgi:DNA-binding response OmpR family regulator